MKVGCINSPSDFDTLMAATGCVDEFAKAMEQKWGVGRLPKLVPPEIAEKFYRQLRLLNQAIESGPIADVRMHADRMLLAWAYCNRMAEEMGAPTLSANQWECRLDDGTVLIVVRSAEELGAVQREERQALTITLETLANACTGLWRDLRAKELVKHFPGAAVERVRVPQPDWANGDEVPF
jgi:uridine phosphorylase